MIVLDAGVVIALFSPDDAHHGRAKALLAEHPGPFLMHSLTVAETLVAAARVGRDAELWGALRDLGVEVAPMPSDEPFLLARLRATHALKMPDTCVLAAAVHVHAPVATFDARLGTVAEAMSLRFAVPDVD
ncbi:PIN domain-containing protein [Microbacterium sp. SL62]|uniref:type II toxin-antitoxin system VapC family toxin n=1 Tax=Microbacterium sp. SL62 TaxID=2995139 RepID=UPI00227300CF|nr:PIN domain-containing protein [Microbacterium sp. SL62]MCY1715396.1 PIN domain-containing protein [Microbacterium sp. SL62]